MSALTEARIQDAIWGQFSTRSELIIPNFRAPNWHECDVFQVAKSLYWVEFEIKISVSDFRADFNKEAKHATLKAGDSLLGPRRFWYVMPTDIAEKVKADIPAYAGLMIAKDIDGYVRLRVVKKAPTLKSAKLTAEYVVRRYETFMWRYWTLRGDFRRLVKRYTDEKGEESK